MPVKAKNIKDLPLKNELDGSESLLVQDLNGTQQAPLGTIVDEIKQNSQEKIREIESELAQTNAQLSSKIYYYDNVNSMIKGELKDGDFCTTQGFHSKGDGGGASYRITSKLESEYKVAYDYGEEEPYGATIQLDNGKYALLHIEKNSVSIRQLGAYGDNQHDDTNVLKFTESCKLFYRLEIPAGNYMYKKPLHFKIASYKEIIGSSTLYAADHYNLAISKLCYYPQERDTVALKVGGTGTKIKDICVEVMDYTKKTTGFSSRIDMGEVDGVRIINPDHIGYILGGRYGKVDRLYLDFSKDHCEYINTDFEQNSLYACVVTDVQDVDGGYIPTNQKVTNMSVGSPIYFISKYGLIINGISLIFDNLSNPCSAKIPILFDEKATNCVIKNCYMERNKNGSYEHHIVYSKGSRGNAIRDFYISDNLRVKDDGVLNTYECTTVMQELPSVRNVNTYENLYNLKFTNINGSLKVTDKFGKDLTSSISYDSKFLYCGVNADVESYTENSVTIKCNSQADFGIRMSLYGHDEFYKLIGKSLMVGCKYRMSEDSDLPIDNLLVMNGYGVYNDGTTIRSILKVKCSNDSDYYFLTLFKVKNPSTTGTITLYDFFIYDMDTKLTVSKANNCDTFDNLIPGGDVIIKNESNVPFKLKIDDLGNLKVNKLNRISWRSCKGAIVIPLTTALVENNGKFDFILKIEEGYEISNFKINNVSCSKKNGIYSIENIKKDVYFTISQ